jgi:hypothetical protein
MVLIEQFPKCVLTFYLLSLTRVCIRNFFFIASSSGVAVKQAPKRTLYEFEPNFFFIASSGVATKQAPKRTLYEFKPLFFIASSGVAVKEAQKRTLYEFEPNFFFINFFAVASSSSLTVSTGYLPPFRSSSRKGLRMGVS